MGKAAGDRVGERKPISAGTSGTVVTLLETGFTTSGTSNTSLWSITANGTPLSLTSVTPSGTLIAIVHAAVSNGDVLLLSYSSGGDWTAGGVKLKAITNFPITNNVPP